MPGILPMKMIRVGAATQSRIAQACDRCRSKKIRCDGVRPCCTQCANVGFECKTSDKLSRRAFPRGYTESLEDRVRGLEAEVRELKALLDEKDEKIDMLSRIHNFSPRSRKVSSSPTSTTQVKAEDDPLREDVIVVEIPAAVQPVSSSIGTSTTAALIEAFDQKVRDSNHGCPNIAAASFLKPQQVNCKAATIKTPSNTSPAPPRLLSDQYINLFFQEWQPLLPILHRPTFLKIYESFLTASDTQSWRTNQAAVAQLFLIFEIAAYSASSKTKPVTTVYELHWRKALSSMPSTLSISTLQSLILAQLCCLLKADYPHLLRHRAHSISMMHQLGLHQGHKNHALPVFDAEIRKKAFWCQYVLDKFTSAATGTPQLIRESDVSVDYPTDIDDENISPQGISPALPGELTKISSALAFFRLSRKLAKVLDTLYPSKATYHISLNRLHALSDELDQWQEELPDHLRLRFRNDKPATNLISCRSPLLSLAYFYARSLIHRPLLCYGSESAASAATIVLAAAAKHQLQIIDLLDERSMNYTFPVSKQDLLVNAGFSVLWQTRDLDKDSKLLKDNKKSLMLMLSKLSKESSVACKNFQSMGSPVVFLGDTKPPGRELVVAVSSNAPVPSSKTQSTRKQLQAIASRLSSLNGKSKNEESNRRASMSQQRVYQSVSPGGRANSSVSLSSTRSAPVLAAQTTIDDDDQVQATVDDSLVNLDYFPFGDDMAGFATNNSSSTMLPPKSSPSVTHRSSWENQVGHIATNSLNACRTVSPIVLDQPTSMANTSNDWPNDLWELSTYDLSAKPNATQSLLSFSEESLTSDDLLFSAAGSHNGSISTTNEHPDLSADHITPEQLRSISIPLNDEFDFQDIAA